MIQKMAVTAGTLFSMDVDTAGGRGFTDRSLKSRRHPRRRGSKASVEDWASLCGLDS